MPNAVNFSKFEEKIGIKFNNKDLLRQAFIHRSYLNENPSLALEHNERLEFLGDAVLEMAVTDYLYHAYLEKTEGEMTSLRAAVVNANMLSEIAGDLEMDQFMLLSKGESKSAGKAKQYILANALEALIGSIYLDSGYPAALSFMEKSIFHKIEEIIEKKLWIDAKSLLQEKAQEEVGVTPTYKIISEYGPDHKKQFIVGVFLDEEEVAKGEGTSKQEAEQSAAKNALKNKNWAD